MSVHVNNTVDKLLKEISFNFFTLEEGKTCWAAIIDQLLAQSKTVNVSDS